MRPDNGTPDTVLAIATRLQYTTHEWRRRYARSPHRHRRIADASAYGSRVHDAGTRRLPSDRQLRSLLLVGAAGLGLAAANRLSDGAVGLPCPWRLLTGLDCPFCGSTRMAGALLAGDLPEALGYNAPVFFLGVGVTYLMLAWGVQRCTGLGLPRPRLSARSRRLLGVVAVVAAAVFMVVRNLPWEPFTQLSP